MTSQPDEPVFRRGQFGHHTYRIPALVDTPHGLVVFAEGRRHGGGDSGEIELLARRSADGGHTWTEPAVVASRPGFTWGNPAPVLVDDDTILLLSCTNGADADEDAIRDGSVEPALTRRVHVQRISLPDLSATQSRDITDVAKLPHWGWYATGPCHGIVLRRGPHAGRIVVACDHSDTAAASSLSRYGCHLLLSDDGGGTWRIGLVESGSPTCSGPNECCATEVGDGDIVVSVRNEARDPGQVPRALVRSADGGETGVLEPRRDLVMPVVQGSATSTVLADGRELVVLCGPSDPDRRAGLALRGSSDGGRTFGDLLVVDAGPSAYSDLVVTPDGMLHVVWEGGESSPYEGIRHTVIDPAALPPAV